VLLYLASAHSVNRLVEILDQMKAIVDQRGVWEQLRDIRNVGLPHFGRNGLDFALHLPHDSLQQGFSALFVASLSHIKDHTPLGITQHLRILVASVQAA